MLPSVFRVLAKLLCPEMADWDLAAAASADANDSAAPTAQARLLTMKRPALLEAATWRGMPAVQILWGPARLLRHH